MAIAITTNQISDISTLFFVNKLCDGEAEWSSLSLNEPHIIELLHHVKTKFECW